MTHKSKCDEMGFAHAWDNHGTPRTFDARTCLNCGKSQVLVYVGTSRVSPGHAQVLYEWKDAERNASAVPLTPPKVNITAEDDFATGEVVRMVGWSEKKGPILRWRV